MAGREGWGAVRTRQNRRLVTAGRNRATAWRCRARLSRQARQLSTRSATRVTLSVAPGVERGLDRPLHDCSQRPGVSSRTAMSASLSGSQKPSLQSISTSPAASSTSSGLGLEVVAHHRAGDDVATLVAALGAGRQRTGAHLLADPGVVAGEDRGLAAADQVGAAVAGVPDRRAVAGHRRDGQGGAGLAADLRRAAPPTARLAASTAADDRLASRRRPQRAPRARPPPPPAPPRRRRGARPSRPPPARRRRSPAGERGGREGVLVLLAHGADVAWRRRPGRGSVDGTREVGDRDRRRDGHPRTPADSGSAAADRPSSSCATSSAMATGSAHWMVVMPELGGGVDVAAQVVDEEAVRGASPRRSQVSRKMAGSGLRSAHL